MKKIRFNPYVIFENNEKDKFLYLVHNNSIFAIDDKVIKLLDLNGETYEAASKILERNMTEVEFSKLYQNMRDAQLVITDESCTEKASLSSKEQVNLRGITLMTIQECNLRCTYCYGDGGEYQDKGKMPFEIAKKSIDFLVNNSTERELMICFLGGEPLLNFPLLVDVVKYCEEKEANTDRHFRYTITTNGTVWNNDIENFLQQKQFTVQISVDGAEEVHNCNRFYANKVGSYETMERNTRKLREMGVLSGRATITRTNLNVVDNFNALDAMNFRSIPMAPAQNLLSEEDYQKLINENQALAKYFLELVGKGDYNKAKKMRLFMSGLLKIHKSGNVRNIPCGVGSTQIAIDINGDIFPCHRFVANKEYSMGNVTSSTRLENKSFLDEVSLNNHKGCSECWAKNLCVGACPNENLVNTGSTQEATKKSCDYIKALYKELIHIYINLSSDEKKALLG